MKQPVHSGRRAKAIRSAALADPAPVAKVAAPARGKAVASAAPSRTNDPERTMADIIEVAMREFADKGLAGARIDVMAEAMRTSKRMIYYYFGSKEALYVAVLEESYRRMRDIERGLHLEDLQPEDALRKLVAFTVDYQWSHPDYIRLVMNENMHRGEYMARSQQMQEINVPAIEGLRGVYERGVKHGVFRSGLDPIDLHMTISALSVFNVANRHTFSVIFKRDLADRATFIARRDSIVETIVRFVRT